MEEIQSYWQVAGIAHFCYLFSEAFRLPRVNYEELEYAFLNCIKSPLLYDPQTGSVIGCSEETDCIDIENRNVLVNVICSLLRGCTKKLIDYSNWDQVLVELFEMNSVDENQASPFRYRKVDSNGKIVEHKMTFDDLSLYQKVKVVYALCEMRFYREDRLDKVNEIEVEELRVEPLGQDADGCNYWYFFGTRLYKENPKTVKKIEEKRAKIERLKELELRSALAKSKMLNKKQIHTNRSKLNKSNTENSNTSVFNQDLNLSTTNEDSLSNSISNVNNSSINEHNTSTLNGDLNESTSQTANANKLSQIPLPEITSEEMKEAWSVICKTEKDWNDLTESFKKSKNTYEKNFYQLLSENFVPNIHAIFLRKEQEERKRQLQMLPKRNSSRLQIKRIQQEEEERIQRLVEEEEKRKKLANRKYSTRHIFRN